jgi:hypothetical protein
MGYSELSIPVDIPWKRLGVSRDMLDPRFGDLKFPAKWDTSIAVFYHEPAEVDPAYCHRKIAYVKVVCTIANYQLGRNDVTVLNDLRKSLFDTEISKDFELAATRAYPCHGALLQVGVYPNPGAGVELHDFPYISSVQPRKRELYEVATQSGEIASQSANKLNVLKGNTTTGTTEDYDLDTGGGSGGHSGVFGLWSEQHSGETKQVGTIQRHQTQDQNVATSDASRDRRESYSFSTSINQLYTLLQTFHIGTNRAMFFLQPTPHMQDAKFSFVQGLRRIEGVQEFFLIVNRPEHVKGLCLEIALETAHDYVRRRYSPRLIAISDLYAPGNLAKTEAALGAAIMPSGLVDWYRAIRDAWNLMWPDQRWAANKSTWSPTNAAEGLAAEVPVKIPGIGAQDVALIFEEYEASTGYYFVAGRRFCACWTPPESSAEDGEQACEVSSPANLSHCDPDPGGISLAEVYDTPARTTQHMAQYYNARNQSLNEALSSSLLSPRREPFATRSFFATGFMVEELIQLVHRADEALRGERPIRELAGLSPELKARLGPLEDLSLREFTRMSTRELARRLAVGEIEALKVQSDVLVAALASLDRGKLPITDAAKPDERMHERDMRFAASARGDARPHGDRPQDARPNRK